MRIPIPIKNANSLLILDRNQWSSELSKTPVPPSVALISSWGNEESGFRELKPLIESLMCLGCRYFVCAGKTSESLHDFIDDLILDASNQHEECSEIMTTWHDTDTDSEVADFFLHSTSVIDSLLVAFLDEGSPEDGRLKKAILKNASSG